MLTNFANNQFVDGPPTATPPRPKTPVLTLSGYAWAKWNHLCHLADTEVGFFGIAAEDDPFHIVDLAVPKQTCTACTTTFDDGAVNKLMIDLFETHGVTPDRCVRVWLHTHPGNSTDPSGTDETTFADTFGNADFAVMAILGKGGDVYARLRVKAGGPDSKLRPTVSVKLKTEVSWEEWAPVLPGGAEGWAAELKANVSKPAHTRVTYDGGYDDGGPSYGGPSYGGPGHYAATGHLFNPYTRVKRAGSNTANGSDLPREIATLGFAGAAQAGAAQAATAGSPADKIATAKPWYQDWGFDSEEEARGWLGDEDIRLMRGG